MARGKRAVRTPSRRRDRLPVYLVVGILLVLVFVVLSLTVLFHLDRFRVEGEIPYSEEEVVAATGLAGGENLLRLNTDAVEKQILANLPYLETVEVSVSLPDTLTVTCTSAKEYAYVAKGEICWIVDRKGRVLAETHKPGEDLLCLSGVNPPEAFLAENAEKGERTYIVFDDVRTSEAFTALADELEDTTLGKITQIRMPSYLDISFVVENRIKVRLGTMVDMPYKMKYVNRLFQEENVIPTDDLAVIDASNTERVSVKANPLAGLTEADILG